MPAAVIRATAEDIATAWGEFVLNLTEAELRTGAAALLADPGFVAAAVQPSFVDAANLLQRHLSAEACAPQACAPESRNRLAEEFAARLARMKIARIGST